MYKLGIDIGTSHIGLGIYDSIKKSLVKKKYIPYKPSLKIFNKIFKKIATKKYLKFLTSKIDSFIINYKIEYIGIGCPGKVDTKEGIFYGSKKLSIGKINFKTALKKYNCEIFVDNNSNCAAIGEALENDYKNFLMIIIGTRVGFALIRKTRKKILLANDDEINKIININKIDNTDNKYIQSFEYLSEKYNKLYNKNLSSETIFNDLKNSKHLIDKYIKDFITGIDLICKEFKIKNICIGGSFSLYKKHYLRKLQKELETKNIFIAKNYNDSGIIGAINLPIKRY